MAKAIYNGILIDLCDASISIANKGYFFDFAVYSSIKVLKGKLFFPDFHVDRLFQSAKLLNLEHSFTKAEVLSWLQKLVKSDSLKDSLLRIILIGDPDHKDKVKLYIFAIGGLTFYPDKLYKKGAKVITYQGDRRIPQAKTVDLLLNFIAYKKAQEANALDALLIDYEGNIREGTRSNFFAVKDNTLITPPIEKVLEGITKKLVLSAVSGTLTVKFEDIASKNLLNFDEFFITSTSMNVMPLRQINDMIFDTDFEKTHRIQKLFKEYIHKNNF